MNPEPRTLNKRCAWGEQDSMIDYHDNEWGVPVHDDRQLFEMLTLEGAQAGLSWATILKRRSGYIKAFANFNIKKVSQYGEKEIEKLMSDTGIIRNRLKIISTIENAKSVLEIKKEFGSFDKYLWAFAGNKPRVNKYKSLNQIPAQTEISEKISNDLKKRGFKFVGPTIIYAFMQAIGIVNDHEVTCFRFKEVQKYY